MICPYYHKYHNLLIEFKKYKKLPFTCNHFKKIIKLLKYEISEQQNIIINHKKKIQELEKTIDELNKKIVSLNNTIESFQSPQMKSTVTVSFNMDFILEKMAADGIILPQIS